MPKCKICGSRVADGVSKCPMCGNPVAGTEQSSGTKPTAQSSQTSHSYFVQQPQQVQSVSSATAKVKCAVCGARIEGSATRCPACGALVAGTAQTGGASSSAQATYVPPKQNVQSNKNAQTHNYSTAQQQTTSQTGNYNNAGVDATDDELEDAYITGTTYSTLKNGSYYHYKETFAKLSYGDSAGWNWCSFFLNALVILYRKHYMRAAIYILISYLLPILFSSVPLISVAATIGMLVFTALSNDRVIYNRYKKVASNARTLFPNDAQNQIGYVAKKGGKSVGAVVIYIIALSIIGLIFGANNQYVIENVSQNSFETPSEQFELGYRYYLGDGVLQNYEKAIPLFKKSAEAGNADAQYVLGICYYNGEGIEKDYYQAVHWLKKAAVQGDSFAIGFLQQLGETW